MLAAVPPALLVASGVLAGAVIGSFLATVALRWPRNESAVSGRSHCDACGAVLRWWELVPLLSWVMVRGRCARCGAAIAMTHPSMELAGAAIGGAALWLAPHLGGWALALLGWQLLLLGWLDARHYWLPHRLSAILAVTGLVLGGAAMAELGMAVSLADRAIGLVAGFASLFIVAKIYRVLRGRDGLGGGDAPMFGAIGAWTGWTVLPLALLCAAIAGIAIALTRSIRDEPEKVAVMQLPLGTLLALATPTALIALLWR